MTNRGSFPHLTIKFDRCFFNRFERWCLSLRHSLRTSVILGDSAVKEARNQINRRNAEDRRGTQRTPTFEPPVNPNLLIRRFELRSEERRVGRGGRARGAPARPRG